MLEITGITLFLSVVAYLGVRIALTVKGPGEVVGLVLCLGGGYLFSDLLSGLVHWAGDTLGTEKTPVFGRHFVTPFRQHHVDPKAITRHDFVETNGNNCLASLPLMVGVAVLLPEDATPTFYTYVVVAFASFFVFCTNQFHKWAHADHPPSYARVLQRWGIILRPGHHEIHHASPHDKYYCITVGWLNPVLGKTRFFRALEWVVSKVRPTFLHIQERQQGPAGEPRVPGMAP
jgi:ubiquitin-conjugating enzyme E2 variant